MRTGREDEGFEPWYAAAHRQVLAALVTYCGDVGAATDAARWHARFSTR